MLISASFWQVYKPLGNCLYCSFINGIYVIWATSESKNFITLISSRRTGKKKIEFKNNKANNNETFKLFKFYFALYFCLEIQVRDYACGGTTSA